MNISKLQSQKMSGIDFPEQTQLSKEAVIETASPQKVNKYVPTENSAKCV